MLRTGASASRSMFRAVSGANAFAVPRAVQTSKLCSLSKARPQALAKPLSMALARYETTRAPMDKINKTVEKDVAGKTIPATPEIVSTQSSTHPVFSEVGTPAGEKDADMMAGMKNDLKTIQETFSLGGVPREAYIIGMAGVLPYLATSLSTVYCAWELNHASATGAGYFLSQRTAELTLHVLEPLQVGYGAVIISFLGAIHWGLEFAGYGGHQGYKRYAIGVVAPAVAWPTILFPVEQALIIQFLAFNFLYYADSRATTKGWAPSWYGVYRFILTFIVGGSIVITLIGRGQIVDQIGKLPGTADRIKQLRDAHAEEAEAEEEARRKDAVAAEEGDAEEKED